MGQNGNQTYWFLCCCSQNSSNFKSCWFTSCFLFGMCAVGGSFCFAWLWFLTVVLSFDSELWCLSMSTRMNSFPEVNLCERFFWFSFRESCCSELLLLALQRGYQQRPDSIFSLQNAVCYEVSIERSRDQNIWIDTAGCKFHRENA